MFCGHSAIKTKPFPLPPPKRVFLGHSQGQLSGKTFTGSLGLEPVTREGAGEGEQLLEPPWRLTKCDLCSLTCERRC